MRGLTPLLWSGFPDRTIDRAERISHDSSMQCVLATFATVFEGEKVTPLSRIVNVYDYLDYITNRVMPDFSLEIKKALELLWSSSSVSGFLGGAVCGFLSGPADYRRA